MKKLLVTAVLSLAVGFFSFPLVADISQLFGSGWHPFFVVPGYNTTDALVGHCTKDISRNGHGWVFVNREFFGCSKINIVISDVMFGEYKFGKSTAAQIKALETYRKTGIPMESED